MLRKYILLFITFFLLPLYSETPLLSSKQLDDSLIASGRSGGGRHSSSRSSHHSSSKSRHSHSRTSSSRSHRSRSSHYSPHGTKTVSRIRHPMHVYPRYTPDSTVIYGGTPIQTEEGIPSFADKIPNPPQPTPQPPSISDQTTSDQNENTSQDTTTIRKDDQTGKTSTIVTQKIPKKFRVFQIPEAIKQGIYQYCLKKYFDKDEKDQFIRLLNGSLIYICLGEMLDAYEAMMQQQPNPPPDSPPGGPPS